MNQVTGKSTNGNLHNLTVSLEYSDFWCDWIVVFTGTSEAGSSVKTYWPADSHCLDIGWIKFAAELTADHVDTYNFLSA